MTVFTDTAAEGIGLSDVGHGNWNLLLAEAISTASLSRPAMGYILADGIGLAGAVSNIVKWGATVAEGIGLASSNSVTVSYKVVLAEGITLNDKTFIRYLVTAAEGIGVTTALAVAQGVKVIQQLGLLDAVVPSAKYHITVADSLRVLDQILRYVGASASETVGVADAASTLRRLYPTATDNAGMTDEAFPSVVFGLTASEEIVVQDDDILSMIYNQLVAEGIQLSGGILQNGGFAAFAINTRTGAVSDYSNFQFNSFARLGNRYLAASSDGLYELDGATDAGTNIVSTLRSGYTQFYGSHLTSISEVYIGMRGQGDFYLKIHTENGDYTYKFRHTSMKTSKVRTGKGIRARYFAFELENASGQPFDLDSVEFVPIVAKRRV